MKSPHLDAVWLRTKYIDEGKSTYDIGTIVGRDPKRIYEKLRDFGIPTRPRGLNLKGPDNHMKAGGVNPFLGRKHTDTTRARLSQKASVPKPYLRGHRNGMSGRIGPLNPRFIDGSSPERQRVYASGKWKEVIRSVYSRDNYRCQRCNSTHQAGHELHAHHIRPWAGNKDMRLDITNIVTLCRPCHQWVHSKANTLREFLS